MAKLEQGLNINFPITIKEPTAEHLKSILKQQIKTPGISTTYLLKTTKGIFFKPINNNKAAKQALEILEKADPNMLFLGEIIINKSPET